jgi:glycosyltransferase involved in cell wall biosynthesis
MKGADVFVFPSLYEGFGLPVLDAMVAGIPVVASDTSSLPEVIGDAGILVNPFDPSVISHAIFSILSNENLRKHLIQRGFERVKRFSWEKTAQETLKVLTSVA